jgi:hypothetical protein
MNNKATYTRIYKPDKLCPTMVKDDGVVGNSHRYKKVSVNGEDVVLTFVVRSDEDVKRSHHPAYKLLVP